MKTDPENIVLLAFVFYLGFLFLLRCKKEIKLQCPREVISCRVYVFFFLIIGGFHSLIGLINGKREKTNTRAGYIFPMSTVVFKANLLNGLGSVCAWQLMWVGNWLQH